MNAALALVFCAVGSAALLAAIMAITRIPGRLRAIEDQQSALLDKLDLIELRLEALVKSASVTKAPPLPTDPS